MAFWMTIALVFAADRAAKWLAQATLVSGGRVVALAGVLEWRLTYNRGMALGFLADQVLAGLLLPVLVVTLGALLLRRYQSTRYTRLAVALVIGGFLGNLADRLLIGYVVDMVFFPWMPWYVCNVADIAICAGIAMLMISLLFRPADWKLKTEGNGHEADRPDGRR